MTQEQLEVRKERAEKEVFVITATEEAWRVRSARSPSRFYLLSGNQSGPRCNCPHFQQNAQQDPAWQCKHVLAVQAHQAETGATDPQAERELAEERAAIQSESSLQAQPVDGMPTAAQMLIRRRTSAGGRAASGPLSALCQVAKMTPRDG
jgi:predicted nucleic acid-binding Zn finger protein